MHNSVIRALTVLPQPLKVSPQENAFCLAIVEGLNKSDAYRRAYKPQRAKPKTIHEKASRIMARGKVRARIQELMAPVIAQAQMTRTEWLARVVQCCRFDPRKLFDDTGKPKQMIELDPNEAAAILAYQITEGFQEDTEEGRTLAHRTFRFRFMDRISALALLGKACHYYADRQEQTGPDAGPIPQNLTVKIVDAPLSPDEAYRRVVDGPP